MFRKIIKKQIKVRVNVDVYHILYPVLLSYYSVCLRCRLRQKVLLSTKQHGITLHKVSIFFK
jgi:hypothetical protein